MTRTRAPARPRRTALLAIALLVIAGYALAPHTIAASHASAAASPPPAPPPPLPTPQPPADPLAGLPPQVRIGARAAHTRRNLPVVPAVVIVPNGDSYAAAIAAWSIYARYPVLIDDGSWSARQDIARFVNAFRPASVVRWSAPASAALPGDAADRRAAIESAVAAAWDAPNADDPASLRDRWKEISLTPPGLVVTSERDPAWTAALALAAGRGQLLVWTTPGPEPISGEVTLAAADSLSRTIEAAAASSGYSWNALGDDLDAITLCLDFPVKINLGESNKARMWATTDVLGRDRAGDRTARWAWAGQVFGSEPAAAYRAMCALFLQPRNAWLFDGYENKEPWSQWDATAAAIELERAGMATVVNDNDEQGVREFRLRAANRHRSPAPTDDQPAATKPLGGVRFGLIAVNTSGNPEFFDLRPGRALAGDVPILATPAIVHFVHSWSANRPGDRATIAGRFLEHGAYAYVGSVHEPYLQAFAPTPALVRRLLARAPLGVAARLDGGPPWKIAILGDPLITLGPDPAQQPLDKLPLEGAVSLSDSLAAALKDRRFEQAIAELAILGRHDDVARLIRALAADTQTRLEPGTALAAAPSLYLGGAIDLFVETYQLAAHAPGAPPALRDMLWHALWPALSTLRPSELTLLRLSLRDDQMARDAAEVYEAIQRADGADAADDFRTRVLGQLPGEDARRQFNEHLKQ